MGFVFVFLGMAVLAIALILKGAFVFLPALVIFVVAPLLDRALPLATTNERLPKATHALPFVFVPAHLAVLGWALVVLSTENLLWWERVGLTIGTGFGTALAINVAHELMHRPGRLEQALASVLMLSASYPHFCIEHIYGHHKNVATPDDPATSRLGESLYAFMPRTLAGSLRSAWRIEWARVGFGLRNRMLAYFLLYVATLAGIYRATGSLGVIIFLGQSVVAVLLLESINYVEHYGLLRDVAASGRPERVKAHHSWNSPHRFSNWVLINLARHSDHHAAASRPFYALRHFDDVPQLPASYPAMILIALVPPLWFRLMGPRVERARRIRALPST
ncbi:MAG: alkane 1-monooxygenase [Polyangiaceae bacterium]